MISGFSPNAAKVDECCFLRGSAKAEALGPAKPRSQDRGNSSPRQDALYVCPIEFRDLGRAHPVKSVARQSRRRDLPAAGVDRCRTVRAELFGKARLELVEDRRRILERAVVGKLQIALDRVEQ